MRKKKPACVGIDTRLFRRTGKDLRELRVVLPSKMSPDLTLMLSYAQEAPRVIPGSIHYAPEAPRFIPGSLHYAPEAPGVIPGSLHYAPEAPRVSPGSLHCDEHSALAGHCNALIIKDIT